MARKYEFKPDKPNTSFLSKLYLTKRQRLSLLKWGLYALVLLVLSALQDVVLCRFRLFGATTDLVPCAIFLICTIQGLERGSVFALVAALFYLFSGTAPGPYAMVFITFLAVGVTWLRQSFLQAGFAAAMFCTGAAMLVYEMAVFATGLFLQLTLPVRFLGFLLTAGLSLLAAPVLYPICLTIGRIGGESWKE